MRQLKKAYLEITNVCNLACCFCPGTRRTKGFLSPENFRTLAARLRPHTQYLYLHLMGEPLLHPQLGKLLEICRELAFRAMITTNGTLLPKAGAVLLQSPAVEKVSISLHSFEGNEGGQSLEGYLEDCLSFARAAGEAGKRCALRLWNLDGENTLGSNSYNGKILATIEGAFPRPWREGRRGTTLAPNVFLEWGERFSWPDLSAPEEGGRRFCYGLRDQVGVLWDGTVVPCCLDHEGDVSLGSLYDRELEEILNGPRARAIYDGFSRRQPAEELCRRCGYATRFNR